jgi:hypothetical protein
MLFSSCYDAGAYAQAPLFSVSDLYELAAVGDVAATPCDVIWLWMLSKVLVVFVPTAFTTRIATMAISASTNPYSTSDCPLFLAFFMFYLSFVF